MNPGGLSVNPELAKLPTESNHATQKQENPKHLSGKEAGSAYVMYRPLIIVHKRITQNVYESRNIPANTVAPFSDLKATNALAMAKSCAALPLEPVAASVIRREILRCLKEGS